MANLRSFQYEVQTQEYKPIPNSAPESRLERVQQELNNLQSNFIAVQNKLLDDAVLYAEYEALQRKSEHEKRFVTPLLKSEVLMPFATLVQKYQSLRAELTELINVDELEQIEASVMAEAVNKSQYEKRYFPAYQQLHESAVAKHALILNGEIQQLKQSQTNINSAYKRRKDNDYDMAYLITGVLSVFGIGLPFLIGTLIINAIDKIQQTLKDKKINQALTEKQSAVDQQFNPEASLLNDAIARHPGMLLRQSIFSINKERQALARLNDVSEPGLTLVK